MMLVLGDWMETSFVIGGPPSQWANSSSWLSDTTRERKAEQKRTNLQRPTFWPRGCGGSTADRRRIRSQLLSSCGFLWRRTTIATATTNGRQTAVGMRGCCCSILEPVCLAEQSGSRRLSGNGESHSNRPQRSASIDLLPVV